jgi:hypothetical protein
MSGKYVIEAVKPAGANVALTKDADGYYYVTLGALNVYNEAGDFYLEDGVAAMIASDQHILGKALKGGYLKGEAGHPMMDNTMTKTQFLTRNFKVLHDRVSHHIKSVELIPSNIPSGMPGKGNTILIKGWVKPDGPFGDQLQKSLDDPNQNTAFSIRSFTSDTIIGGVNIKKINAIITWDWVMQPGIKIANKYSAAGIAVESISSITISNEELSSPAFMEEVGRSFESNEAVMITNTIKCMCGNGFRNKLYTW